MKTKKLLLMALFMLAAIGVKAQYITVFFWDTVGDFTNIRNAPNGKIVEKVSTSIDAMLLVETPVNGWWSICDASYYEPDGGLYKLSGSRSGYYIHYSCIGVGTRNYGGQTLYLRATPSSRAKVVYSFKEELVLHPMDVKGDWVKVSTIDGKHTGWIQDDWLCGNPVTNCN
jgi:SH3-like domain-containing protein